jgi:hypothetical protein
VIENRGKRGIARRELHARARSRAIVAAISCPSAMRFMRASKPGSDGVSAAFAPTRTASSQRDGVAQLHFGLAVRVALHETR